MRRHLLLGVLGVLMSATYCGFAAAQPAMARIAVLLHGTEAAMVARLAALRDGLQKLGYAEGRNYRMEIRYTDNRLERLPSLAHELVAMKPDVTIGSPMLASQALHRETKTIPIVMASGAGARQLGLIASLARPGGNVTGSINQLEELTAKQLELMRELAPRATRVMTLSSGKAVVEQELREGSRAAARALGLSLVEAWAEEPAKFAEAAAHCRRERCEALLVLLDPNYVSLTRELVALAEGLRVPAIYFNFDFVDAGGMAAYSTDVNDIFRRVAGYVDKILKGAKPGDLPVEQPTRFELAINQRAAKAIGFTIPRSLLLRADRVIE
jgi:putative ABC transport system substrate-binding protein